MNTMISTADLADQFPKEVGFIDTPLLGLGGNSNVCAPVATLCTSGNVKAIRQVLSEDGHGHILLVRVTGAGKNKAVFGDQLATRAIDNGWAGVVVFGAVRDSSILKTMPLFVRSEMLCPLKNTSDGRCELSIPLKIGDITIHANDILVADSDGILIFKTHDIQNNSDLTTKLKALIHYSKQQRCSEDEN